MNRYTSISQLRPFDTSPAQNQSPHTSSGGHYYTNGQTVPRYDSEIVYSNLQGVASDYQDHMLPKKSGLAAILQAKASPLFRTLNVAQTSSNQPMAFSHSPSPAQVVSNSPNFRLTEANVGANVQIQPKTPGQVSFTTDLSTLFKYSPNQQSNGLQTGVAPIQYQHYSTFGQHVPTINLTTPSGQKPPIMFNTESPQPIFVEHPTSVLLRETLLKNPAVPLGSSAQRKSIYIEHNSNSQLSIDQRNNNNISTFRQEKLEERSLQVNLHEKNSKGLYDDSRHAKYSFQYLTPRRESRFEDLPESESKDLGVELLNKVESMNKSSYDDLINKILQRTKSLVAMNKESQIKLQTPDRQKSEALSSNKTKEQVLTSSPLATALKRYEEIAEKKGLLVKNLNSSPSTQKELSSVESYKGDKLQCFFHGFGSMVLPNDDQYEGEFNMGKRHGFGIMTSKDGRKIYEGEWKNDHYNGYGVIQNLYYSEEEDQSIDIKDLNTLGRKWIRYEGEFLDSEINGMGSLFLGDGSKLVGCFQKGLLNGQATFTGADGSIVIGEWVRNKLKLEY
eukprot:TRINITY_DN9898_c0_g2_i1.p1 TRINITY_DN9898_c0_g2~~TRINITY_DN9898_c0_g2_i1.p1  ORF type:complete len:561 (+),score=58.14 TRINITY_DN9898_c0_g2_i1:48-1730(+)